MSAYCPFCDENQAYRFVYDGDLVRVIYPFNAACAYHVLIVPKRHAVHIDELTKEEWAEYLQIIQLLDRACRTLEGYIGYNLLSNNGDSRIDQQVAHCHVHMFLRTNDDLESPIAKPHKSNLLELTKSELQNLEALKTTISNIS